MALTGLPAFFPKSCLRSWHRNHGTQLKNPVGTFNQFNLRARSVEPIARPQRRRQRNSSTTLHRQISVEAVFRHTGSIAAMQYYRKAVLFQPDQTGVFGHDQHGGQKRWHRDLSLGFSRDDSRSAIEIRLGKMALVWVVV